MKYGVTRTGMYNTAVMRNGTFKRTRAKRLFFCIKKNTINVLTKLSTSDIIYTTEGETNQ